MKRRSNKATAGGIALILGMATPVVVALALELQKPAPTETHIVAATVLELRPIEMSVARQRGYAQAILRAGLQDGSSTRLLVSAPFPTRGDKIELRIHDFGGAAPRYAMLN